MTRRASERFSLAAADIQTAVAWIAAQADALGATQRQSFGAQLCAEEILVNAIRHGGRSRLTLSVMLESLPDRLRLTLEDDGAAFDLAAAPERRTDASLDESRPGGWGLSLVRRFAARIDYRRTESGNWLILDFSRESDP
ncbi:ATP-binding protein [Methylocystis sp. IM3]|uniref:ATP-binding protein n=1 Tax=unclassified Methylocystis TaxID=2625913 RepID=UPI0030F782D6